MYSDPLPNSGVAWRKSDPHLFSEEDKNPAEQPQASKVPGSSAEPSLFKKLLVSCGGFVETAALLLGPSDCISCVNEPFRSYRSSRSMRRQSSKTKLKHASKLNDSPSREGEVVDVPIKLVKSRSGKAKENEDGQVYDPYRSFDDSISAISAHTLDEMARRYPNPFMATLRTGQSGTSSRPRNGDELRPPSPARISDDSSDDSGQRDESSPPNEIENDIPFRRKFDEPLQITKVEQNRPTYELIENDIPFVKKKRPSWRGGNGKSDSTSTKASDRPVDKHNEPTPTAKGRKSRRRSSKRNQDKVEPQLAEI